MSYLDAISKIRSLDECVEFENYSYDQYLQDMSMLECSMYHEINKVADESSIEAIKALTEGVEIDPDMMKDTKLLTESIANEASDKASDKSYKQLMSQYTHARKCIDQTLDFISIHKKDIEHTTISSNYTHYNGKCKKVDDVQSYELILKKFSPSVIKDSDNNKGVLLGSKAELTADDINSKKDILMKNISSIDKFVNSYNKRETIKFDKISPSECIKEMIKVKNTYSEIIKYCIETKKLLNKFVSYDEGGND